VSIAGRLSVSLLAALAVLATAAAQTHALGAGGEKAAFGVGGNEPWFLAPSAISTGGRLLFFQSSSTNLVPEAFYGNSLVYARDLDTGETRLVNVAPELVPGKEISAGLPSASADGRFVAVLGTDMRPTRTVFGSVYVHDLQTETTKIASRASGPNGTIAWDAFKPSLSADGHFVAFDTRAALDPADTDSASDAFSDVYVRDLDNDTTILVSRAGGVDGAKGEKPSQNPSISADGRFVAFESSSEYLLDDPLPETLCTCVYLRDLQAHTTTLVSRANGDSDPVTVRGEYTNPAISGDGRLVAFVTNRSLSPDDTDAALDVYVRDTVAHTTILVDRADGPAGPKGNDRALPQLTMSLDGRFVGFTSYATNLSPDDSDALPDAYVRDLQQNTTTLVDRGSGITGAKASDGSGVPIFSADNQFLVFNAVAKNFDRADTDDAADAYVRDLQSLQTSLESRATPGFVRPVHPKGATPFRISLVPAAQPCTAPNSTHGSPLSFGSCSPPTPISPNLTTSAGEVRARSVGFVLLKAFPGSSDTTADEADISVKFRLTNVMHASDLSDYTGELQARMSVRRTDKYNGPGGNEDLTSEAVDFPVTIPCAATSSPTDGSDCSLTTWADVVVPGFAPEGKRSIYDLGQVRVYDGGADGDAETTGDNALLAVQGVFVP
jgi:Tol biopolymer transport system component